MNTTTTAPAEPTPVLAPPPTPLPPPAAWIGLDWGHKEHAFALHATPGATEEGKLPTTAEAIHAWLHALEQRFGGRPVAVGLETSRGAVIHALLQYPWITIYPINPVTSARYRKAFTPSGASDDLPDARVLLELVRDHTAKLRPLEPEDPQTVKLAGLVEARRDLVDRRTQGLNQLTSLLRAYYPQALELVGDLDTELAVDFLERWPDLLTLKTAKPGVLKRFYYAHQLRRPELLEQRLQRIRQAVALTTDEARVVLITDLAAGDLVQLSEVVELTLARSSGQVVVTWPATLAGWQLQASESLAGGWQEVVVTPVVADGRLAVSLPPGAAARFFRLRTAAPAARLSLPGKAVEAIGVSATAAGAPAGRTTSTSQLS